MFLSKNNTAELIVIDHIILITKLMCLTNEAWLFFIDLLFLASYLNIGHLILKAA